VTVSTYLFSKKESGADNSIDLIPSFTFWSRFKGLLGKKSTDIGMIFNQTNQIHMFFMQFAIDVYFLDKQGKVIHIVYNLKPWTISPKVKNACYVIEFQTGAVTDIELGDTFHIDN
jgi:uncharacterized membrane protein (UPF0127 family)